MLQVFDGFKQWHRLQAGIVATGFNTNSAEPREPENVKNILGENILRLLERVDAIGKQIRAGQAG